MGVTRTILISVSLLLFIVAPIYLLTYTIYSPQCRFSSSNSEKVVLVGDPQMEGNTRVFHQGWYGKLNNDFNDWYFWVIMRNVYHLLRPHHIVVLGDLFSSQYIDSIEFQIRKARYERNFGPTLLAPSTTKLINLTGNHDVGYGDDLPDYRMTYFETQFGHQNTVYKEGEHHFVILNSMALDGAYDKKLRDNAWNHLKNTAAKKLDNVILFTHIPLHKPRGVCKGDIPSIRWNEDNSAAVEQTVLSQTATKYILNELKPKYVFTGHDHEGCAYKHNDHTTETIMGDHGGNIGLFEYAKNNDGKYEYRYSDCSYFETTTIWVYFITTGIWAILMILVLIFLMLGKLWRKLTGGEKVKQQ